MLDFFSDIQRGNRAKRMRRSTTMTFSGPVEDRLAIRELGDRYSDGVLHKDPKVWGATWAEDGIWELRGIRVEGRAAIVEYWIKAMEVIDVLGFLQQPGSIQVDGTSASARVNLYEWGRYKDGKAIHGLAYFDDKFVKINGVWLYKQRSITGLLRE
jgi:SnoaL-like domain